MGKKDLEKYIKDIGTPRLFQQQISRVCGTSQS